jgi:membrane-bound lytic murein transglycosylase B
MCVSGCAKETRPPADTQSHIHSAQNNTTTTHTAASGVKAKDLDPGSRQSRAHNNTATAADHEKVSISEVDPGVEAKDLDASNLNSVAHTTTTPPRTAPLSPPPPITATTIRTHHEEVGVSEVDSGVEAEDLDARNLDRVAHAFDVSVDLCPGDLCGGMEST